MKLLYILGDLSIGGAERTAYNLFKTKDFNKSLLVFLGKKGPEYDPYPGVGKVLLTSKFRAVRMFFLLRILNQYKPDVILSNFWGLSLQVLLIRTLCFTRGVLVFRVTNDDRHRHRNLSFLEYLNRWLITRFCSNFIAISCGVRDYLIDYWGVETSRVVVIYNPLDTDFLESQARLPMDSGLPSRYLVFVGRLVHQKGLDILLNAMAKTEDTALVVIGSGPELQKVILLTNDLGLGGRVYFTGSLANPYPVMAKSCGVIVPSRHEGFCHVVVEALALNVPVIASTCHSGPSEILNFGEFGWLFEVNDDTKLSILLKKLWRDEYRSEMLDQGKKRAAEYDVNLISRQYKHFLQGLIQYEKPF